LNEQKTLEPTRNSEFVTKLRMSRQRSFLIMNDEFRLNYDENEGLPETPEADQLDWRVFNEDFYSSAADANSVKDIIAENPDELIDLRPYMVVHPFTMAPHDHLERACDLFRHHHLRHLVVINPGNGKIVGIVTRKDLFKYMHL